jgi:hypothetical protein
VLNVTGAAPPVVTVGAAALATCGAASATASATTPTGIHLIR